MLFQIWEDQKENELTMCYAKEGKEKNMISDTAVLLTSYNEPDYNKAMIKAHEFLGFEKYIPFPKD